MIAVEVDPTETSDLISTVIADGMDEDKQEIINRAIGNSTHLWICRSADRVLCFYGLIPQTLISTEAYLWMYTSKDIEAYTPSLIRHSRRSIKDMLSIYPTIYGHGSKDNPRSLDWLRLIGAEFGEPQGPLVPFSIQVH